MADLAATLSSSFSSLTSSLVSFVDNVYENLNVEFYRLNTFENWPLESPVYPIRLASSGFYFLGRDDYVRCNFCRIEKKGWKKGDNPQRVHLQLNPHCPFLINPSQTDNIPIDSHKVPLSEQFSRINSLLSSTPSSTSVQDSQKPTVSSDQSKAETASSSSGNLPTVDDRGQDRPSADRRYSSLPSQSDPNPQVPGNLELGRELNSTPFHRQTRRPPAMDQRSLSQQGGERRTSQDSIASHRPLQPLNPDDKNAGLLRYERNRLETFSRWPSRAPVLPRDLAKSGFYYTGSDDRVQCVFCHGILKDWEAGDKPHIEHKSKFPRCPFILGQEVGNVKSTPNHPSQNFSRATDFVNQAPSRMEALGINTERPKHPNYAVEATRLNTFQSWPTYRYQTPEQLTSAGFFYAGFGDNVKCFFCDGGLRNWEAGDDPWVEHTRWFPRCPYVRNVKGEAYITAIQERFNGPQQSASSSSSSAGGHRIEPREIKARMELPVVRNVLETGVNRNTVMIAIERRLRETGDDYPNAESLMNAVLTLEENPEQLGAVTADQSNSSGSRDGGMPTPGPSHSSDVPTPGPSNSSDMPSAGTSSSSNIPSTGQSHASKEPYSKELEEENRILKEQKVCKICLDEDVGIVFLPCGHLCSCVNCAPAIRKCPICREEIRGTVRTYMP